MKTNKILYWVFTVIFAVFMAWSGVGGVKPSPEAITFMHDGLGFPVYFIQFISIAKILGAIVLLIPGLRTIKEWAYAGMFFDLAGVFFPSMPMQGSLNPHRCLLSSPLSLGLRHTISGRRTVDKK
jgi:uncharacterized membrane protein YphA (DoxX/SURF4 family)